MTDRPRRQSMTEPRAAPRNGLLARLPPDARARLTPDLEPIALTAGQVLHDAGSSPGHVVFPLSGIVSLQYLTEAGGCAEIAQVGNDGVIGVALFMGGESTPGRAVVRAAGQALRLPAAQLKTEFKRHAELHVALLRYTQALLTQMAQTAICNRHHQIDQQLCRCLLLSLDRVTGSTLALTQELLAQLLGVRREGVSQAAAKLQREGAIRYTRGRIVVLDRARIEALSCECYRVVRRETERLAALD